MVKTYTHQDRENITHRIESLKNQEDYIAIFNILTSDKKVNYTQNSNGVFLNLSLISNKTLSKVDEYIKKSISKNKKEDPYIVIPKSSTQRKTSRAYKRSNYEENIIRQRNLKKIINNEEDYDELNF